MEWIQTWYVHNPPAATSNPPHHWSQLQIIQCLALHNIGHLTGGVASVEENIYAVVEEATLVYVLHRVLYPQVHINEIKKKQTMQWIQ